MNNIKLSSGPSLKGQMSKCIACSKVFTTVANFDKHRVGPHTKGQRRCLSEDELERIGMVKDHRGVWKLAARGWTPRRDLKSPIGMPVAAKIVR
jgi:hypothetical protein